MEKDNDAKLVITIIYLLIIRRKMKTYSVRKVYLRGITTVERRVVGKKE
jgi:hypothetical protein